MSEKYNYNTPVSEILMMPDGITVNNDYLDIILHENIPVYCENKKEQIFRLMSFKTIYEKNNTFWLQEKNWKYFFTKETLEKLKEKNVVKPDAVESKEPQEIKTESPAVPETPIVRGFGTEYEAIAAMSNTEKVKYLHNIKSKMDTLISISKQGKDRSGSTKAMVETTRDVVMINHSALENVFDLGDVEAKRATQSFVITTQEMVKANTQLI